MNREDYEEVMKFQKNQNKKSSGFLTNTKRSTAYYFSDIALNQFLTDNQLSHVIRAHQVIEDGYKLFLNGRVISLFSSSGYCGLKNKAAAVHIEGHGNEGLIKIISLET